MKIKQLLEGYYAGTLTDTEEEHLEMLMISGHPEIPEGDRRLYLGLVNIPTSSRPARKRKTIAWRTASIAASVLLLLGLGYYIYVEQQRQIMTQQEILEMAMGNMGKALQKSDTTREQLASIISIINANVADETEEETEEHNTKNI